MAEIRSGMTAERSFAEHEHRDLAPGINRIHAAALAIPSAASIDCSVTVRAVTDWVETVLKPHAAWEDVWLYPEIDQVAGTTWATKLMTFEHRQILDVARQLEIDGKLLLDKPKREDLAELRGHLFSLEALLRAHVEREERFLIPLLESAAGEARVGALVP
jgi:hemerythrin-like domain-containing protein